MSYPPAPTAPTPHRRRIWLWILATIGLILTLALTFVFGVFVGITGDSTDKVGQASGSTDEKNVNSSISPSSVPDMSNAKPVELTQRGTLPLKPGTAAVASSPEGELASMTVNSIEVDPVCTGSYARKAKNGHFVVLDVTVKVAPHSTLAKAGVTRDSVSMRQGGFRMIDKEGNMTPGNDIIGNGYGCLPEGTEIATDINAGEKSSGKLIFDVPSPKGSIVLPELLGGVSDIEGWEWEYPAK